jgi:formiminoglutamase
MAQAATRQAAGKSATATATASRLKDEVRMRRRAAKADWGGRSDPAEGDAAKRWHHVVRTRDTAAAPVALIGFACDAGVARNKGRIGAVTGPNALRKALANIPVHRIEAVDDLGDVTCSGDALEQAQADYTGVVADVLRAGSLAIGLGGGHEIAYGSYGGLHAALEAAGDGGAIGIVNFDAHFDLRGDERPNSGTPFRQILEHAAAAGRRAEYLCIGVSRFANTAALFARARDLGVRWVLDEDTRLDRFAELRDELERLLGRVDYVYLTVCLDAFPASVAPGVSSPAVLGIDPGLAERLVDVVIASGKLRVADIAELNPKYDVDSRTARLAARLVARIAEGAVTSRPG